jgi:flavodoxin
MVLEGIVGICGSTYPQIVTKNKQIDSSYESKSENLPITDNTPDGAEAKTNASVQDIYNGISTYYRQFIQENIDKLFVKIENGDTEPTFQIGNRSFTSNEWDEFLEKFDSAEDAIQELVEEEIKKRETISDVQMDMLTTETVQARFPLQAVDEDGNQQEDLYLVAIDMNGIRCSKPGSDEYEWEIVFTDESQYEKATAFMDWTNDHMDNFLFSAHQNFWEDYLNGDMDVEAFQEFLAGTNNGIPDYSITVGDSMYIDKSKAQWAKYMNRPGAKIYTAREMAEMVAQEFEGNQAELTSLSASYSETYKKLHPEYHGEAIFCEYPGGPLYTADEIGKLMYERVVQSRASD